MSTKNLLKDNNNPNNTISNPVNIPSDKILPNSQNLKNDIMKFKDEVLGELKLLKKSVQEKFDFTSTFMNDQFKKYDNKFSSYSDHITEISSQIKTNEDVVKEIKTLLDFKNKIRDSMLTMDIKVNNMDRETKNNIFRIDNILTDSIVYPGIIGKTAKFKTFHQMIDYILAQASQNLTYREKNNLDINQIKKKISTIEQSLQNIKDSISKELNFLFDKKFEESEQKFKNMVLEYDEKLTKAKEQNADYINEIQETLKKFKDKLEEFETVKNNISEEIRQEGKKLKEENDQTQNIFKGYKKEFNLMKDRFTQLSEFIKDVRFRINVGQEVKRREYYHVSSKIDFSKKQKVLNDNNINIYNTKYQNDDDIPDFLKNNYSPNSNQKRSDDINKGEDNKKNGNYSAGNKRIKNKGRNSTFIIRKAGRNPDLNLKDNKTSKTDKTSYELIFEDNETEKYNKSIEKDKNEEEEYSLLRNKNKEIKNIKKRNNSDSKVKETIKRRHTTNYGSNHLENFKQLENKNNLANINFENEAVIQEILEDSNINENKKNMEIINQNYNSPFNIKNSQNNNLNNLAQDIEDQTKNKTKFKILDKNIIKKELFNGPKGNLFSLVNKTPRNILFNGLNKKGNTNIKNISSLSTRINILSNTHSDENDKIITHKNKFTIIDDNNIIGSKKNSKIYFNKKTTVKNLSRIQSAFTPKYPSITNYRPSLKNSNSLNNINNINSIDSSDKNSIYVTKVNNNNNKTSFEEDKINNIIKNSKGFVFNSISQNFNSHKIKSHLSPNVKILQHTVEHFNENNMEANDLTGMINNLQKYINEYDNANYINNKDIKNEMKKMSKNSDYFKLKQIINGNNYNNINNNDKKIPKNKTNLIEIEFNEKK